MAATRIVICGRNLDCRAIGQRVHGLYNALSERLRADERANLRILHGSGENFRCARGIAVYQNSQRYFQLIFAVALIFRLFAAAVDHVENKSFRKDLSCHIDADIDIAARVVPEVDDQAFDVFTLQIGKSFPELIGGYAFKAGNFDITDIIIKDFGIHGRRVDNFPFHLDLQIIILAFARDREVYSRPFLALHKADNIVQRHAVGQLAVDFVNQIIRLEACLLRRRIFHDTRDLRNIVGFIQRDISADASVGSGEHIIQLCDFLFRVINGVRIIERLEKAFIKAIFLLLLRHFIRLIIVLRNGLLQILQLRDRLRIDGRVFRFSGRQQSDAAAAKKRCRKDQAGEDTAEQPQKKPAFSAGTLFVFFHDQPPR